MTADPVETSSRFDGEDERVDNDDVDDVDDDDDDDDDEMDVAGCRI